MMEKNEVEPFRMVIQHSEVEIEIWFDGFCLMAISNSKLMFAASVNDPTVSPFGNISAILLAPEELAIRLESRKELAPEAVIEVTPALCLVKDSHNNICNLPLNHEETVHRDTLSDGTLWAEWRSILPTDEDIRADRYLTLEERGL